MLPVEVSFAIALVRRILSKHSHMSQITSTRKWLHKRIPSNYEHVVVTFDRLKAESVQYELMLQAAKRSTMVRRFWQYFIEQAQEENLFGMDLSTESLQATEMEDCTTDNKLSMVVDRLDRCDLSTLASYE